MRRKSERTATKKTKSSPEKKMEKVKRTRTRRRKQSSSSENESADESSPVPEVEVVSGAVEVEKMPPSTPVKADSPEEAQEQLWHVKASDESGDAGDIKKLKICLARPPSTPERVDKSPRSRRKHSRATSSSDSPSVESVDGKRKSKHRSKKSRDSQDESETDKNDSQEEPDAETINTASELDSEVSQSTDSQHQTSDELPMSTTNEETKPVESGTPNDDNSTQETLAPKKETVPETVPQDNDTADTTVASPKVDTQENPTECNITPKESLKHIVSVDQSEVLEIHTGETKCESSEPQQKEEDSKKDECDESQQPEAASSRSERKVSISEDKKDVNKAEESAEKDSDKPINKTDVVESTEKTDSDEKGRSRNMSTDSDKDKDDNSERYRKRDIERSNSLQSAQEDIAHNGQAPATPPIIVTRKRKWGSRPKVTTQKSITISTDVLKDIIPDVKPVEFDEVIEEKKHRRIDVSEKLPVLPKIVIDNTSNVEQNKKEQEDSELDKSKESHLSANRRISIVKEDDSIITRPPSPPRHKQSNILFITNLVRPFTLPQLKNLLQRTGRIVENGFWIDRIKSKCYVKYENEDQAVETRHALHGVTWPVSNPKTLQVDFSTQEAFEKTMQNEEADGPQVSAIPGTVEDWLREQDMRRERGEIEKPWERKAAMREWDVGKNDKDKEKDKLRREERPQDKRRHRTPSPEPARKFKKKEEEAPAKLLDDLFRKTKATPCIYWLPLSAETIAIKEEQRRQHMAEHERRLQELRRTQHRRH